MLNTQTDTDGAFSPSSAYLLYVILSVLRELANAFPDREYRAVPAGTKDAVSRFEENHFQI